MKGKLEKIKERFERISNNNAVSSALSLTLVLFVFFSATGGVLLWGPAYIDNEKDRQIVSSTVLQYNAIIDALEELMDNGNGSSIISEIPNNGGPIEIDSDGDRVILVYSYDQDYDFNANGLDDLIENRFSIEMTNGQSVDNATLYYLDDSCFLAGTSVSMADGSLKNIEDIVSGDLVRSYDIESGGFVVAKVRSLLQFDSNKMSSDYYLVINGFLGVTPNHKFMVDGDWIEADDLRVGDFVFDSFGKDISINSIKKVYSKEITYDLLLESKNSYFADGYLVRSDANIVVISDNLMKMNSAAKKINPVAGNQQEPPQIFPGRTFYSSNDFYIYEDGGYLNGFDNFIGCTTNFLTICPIQTLWRCRILIDFPITTQSGIPDNSIIQDAKMKLYYYFYEGAGEPPDNPPYNEDLVMHEVSHYWDELGCNYYFYTLGVCEWYEDDFEIDPREPYGGDVRDINDPIEENQVGRIAKTYVNGLPPQTIVLEDNGVNGNTLKGSIQDFVNGVRENYGFLLSGLEDNAMPWYFDFYSSRASVEEYKKPHLVVHYISPPEIQVDNLENQYASDVTETSATLHGYVEDAGLDYCAAATSPAVSSFAYRGVSDDWYQYTPGILTYNDGPFSVPIEGLEAGKLYEFKPAVANDCDNDIGWSWYFFTAPRGPTNLEAEQRGDRLLLTWDKANCYTMDEYIYTKILAKKSSQGWPSGPKDPTAITLYNGTDSSYLTRNGQLQPETEYNIVAYTWAIGLQHPWFFGRWSNQFDLLTAETGIHDFPPTAVIKWDDSDGDGDGTELWFDGSDSSDSEGGITNYSWSFKEKLGGFDIYEHFGSNVSYDSGKTTPYYVTLRVRDESGQHGFSTEMVQAYTSGDSPPIADFNFEDADGASGTLINFDASPSSDDNGIVNYSWDFENDGSWDAYGLQVSYDYGNEDPYWVKLQVKDTIAQTGELTKQICLGHPTTPSEIDFVYAYDPIKYYSGIEYEFSCVSSNSQGDDVWYKIDWGDGTDHQVFGPYTANISIFDTGVIPPKHTWTTSGVYEIRVKAYLNYDTLGDNGPSSDWSNPIAKRVYYKYVVPPDKTGSEEDLQEYQGPVGNEYFFESNSDLSGAVCVYLFNDDYPSGDDPSRGKIPFGTIWLYDLGRITHKSSNSENSKIILENGGVISSLNSGKYVNGMSSIYETDNILGLSFSIFRAGDYPAGSGAGTYRIDFENLNTFTREQQDYSVYNIKMKYSGDYGAYWNDYLNRYYNFDSTSGEDFLVYDNYEGKQLIFNSALIRANLV